jgi:hypothetical protein
MKATIAVIAAGLAVMTIDSAPLWVTVALLTPAAVGAFFARTRGGAQ